jgi:hypothetical protein
MPQAARQRALDARRTHARSGRVPELLLYGGNIPLSTTRTFTLANLSAPLQGPALRREGRQRDYATLRWTVNRNFYTHQGKGRAAAMKAGKLRRSRRESGKARTRHGE